MILTKPLLALKRLIVFKQGKAVYDEVFHHGVNIVRGTNSSGKSTIADFIFFVLGGDYISWKPEAEDCDIVTAELEINEAVVTVKREVSKSPRRPMYIYWGNYEAANKSGLEGWEVFPFQRSENKESFSQILFRALELPEVKSDDDNNITMHQILRLLYVDQLSPVDLLMRTESFDSGLIRATVGDLMLGIYDDSLYSDQLELRVKQKDFESIKRQIESVLNVFGDAEQEVDIKEIRNEIELTNSELDRIKLQLDSLYESQKNTTKNDRTIKFEIIRDELKPLKEELSKLLTEADELQFEIQDSQEFIFSLERREKALEDSIVTRTILGELPLSYCPHCLQPLEKIESPNKCQLCKQEINDNFNEAQILRMRQELYHQIKESKILLDERKKNLSRIIRRVPEVSERINILQGRYNEAVQETKSNRDEKIDSLLIKQGELESKLGYLHKQAKALQVLEDLKFQRIELENNIEDLTKSIQRKKMRQQRRLAEAMLRISSYTKDLLRKDLPREEFFKTGQFVNIDFSKNTFSIDNRNQFSASSITYLKNSVHFAIFFASLDLDFFRYPRFILCDNMEDKGMEEERSRNFQRVIVDLARKFEVKHQIIFTTSMIDPSLNNTELCIGDDYNEDNKSLNI